MGFVPRLKGDRGAVTLGFCHFHGLLDETRLQGLRHAHTRVRVIAAPGRVLYLRTRADENAPDTGSPCIVLVIERAIVELCETIDNRTSLIHFVYIYIL